MALTQVFPKFEASLADLDRDAVVPRCRPAVAMEFRNGAPLEEFVARLGAQRYVSVNAAPGAGKSTRLPLALAATVDIMVLHVLPFTPLAAVTYRHVARQAAGVPVVFVEDVNQEYPASGLCITSAAQVVARWLQAGRPEMPECYVLHDESHESGAASAALRAFMPSLANVYTYALMSATGSLEPSRKMETGGSVVERTYAPEEFSDPWSVEEYGAPWTALTLPGHILIFEDDKSRASALMQAYNRDGVGARRLHAGSSNKEVLAAFEQFDDPRANGVCAFIVDSTYRSGYTFPASVVVDSGIVRRMVVEDGRPRMASRGIYEFERVQARSRGGRTPGLESVYWRPVGDVPNTLCDLEQTDAEALALIFRALGFRPPREVAGAVMARGRVPRDLCVALRGNLPLPCLPEQDLVDPTPRGAAAAGAAVAQSGSSLSEREVLPAAVTPVAGLQPVDVPGRGCDGEESAEDVLAGLFATLQQPRELVELGEYCLVRGVCTGDTRSLDFPSGVDSVMRVLGSGARAHVHASWSDYQRSVALNALVNSHNVELLQWRAWTRVLKYAKGGTAARDPVSLHKWAVRCAEEASRLAARVETALAVILEVAEGHVQVMKGGDVFAAEEDRLYRALVRDFDGVAVMDDSRVVEEKKRVRSWVEVADSRALAHGEARKRVGQSGSGSAVSGVPGWLKYAAGYTGNMQPRVERISDSRTEGSGTSSGTRVSSSGSSSYSAGKRKMSFIR